MLVDSERIVSVLEADLIGALGIPMDEERARALFKGKTIAQTAEEIERLLGRRLPATWLYDWGFEVAALFARKLRAVDGVEDVVRLLASAKVPLGVASQSPPPRIALSLALTNLAEYFGENLFSASMVNQPKPAPDLYLHAAAKMNATPKRCAVIEDSPSGAMAAVAAGMTVFGYAGDEDAEALARAGAQIFMSMRELPALLEGI